MVRISVALGAAVVALSAASCSSAGNQTEPVPGPTAPSVSASAPVATPSPPGCPDGAYRLASFEPHGAGSPIGAGQGGGVRFIFSGGTFVIGADGTDPIRVDVGPAKAQLQVDGEIRGTYSGPADALRLVAEDTTGELRLKGFGTSRQLSMRELAGQIIPAGTMVDATCDPDGGARLKLPRVDLVLARA